MKNILSEILDWSQERPGWQRDALRRLFTAGTLLTTDVDDLVDLCKAAHGLAAPKTPQPVTKQHLAVQNRQINTVSLVSVTHHRGVNALATEQTVAFGANLTVVYGQTGTGKSGYTRILKRACRSRGIENVLGNVLSGETPLNPQATIRFREGSIDASCGWTPDAAASDALASVSVFDSHCVPVYLRDKTDVAFRPFGLDIFDKLSIVCGEVRARLEAEQAKLNASAPALPVIQEGTRVRALLDALTALTKVDAVQALATLSATEERRLKEFRDRLRDFQATDPKQRARELNLKAERLSTVVRHLEELGTLLSDASLSDFQSAADGVRVAREALALVRKTALTADVLLGTGEDIWRKMWEAAGAFSEVVYPGAHFPVLTKDARCPLCQQSIGAEASDRLKHLAEFIASQAQAEVRSAEKKYRDALAKLEQVVVERNDVVLAIDEFAGDDAPSAQRIKEFLVDAGRLQGEVKAAAGQTARLPAHGLRPSPVADVRTAAETLRDRAIELQAQKAALEPKDAAELKELEARTTLKDHLPTVLNEIERKKRLAAYRQCLDDTLTQAVTRKSTELTKELVTDQLRKTFKDELARLEFTHLLVEVQAAGGAKGALFHRVVFSNAPGVTVTDVLSEGESRALSLAAFLTELSTATTGSAIIFDDPVSSLDHIWRERIARRLVAEAKVRQVIIFTHDLLFLRLLLDECRREQVRCDHQYVRREGQAGVCSPDLPWVAMGVKDRIGSLRGRWQAADKLHRTSTHDAYEKEARDIYGLLREAWEQAVGEILLNDVVERYRPSIETQRVKHLHDITAADCKAMDDAMTECSRWIRGHDHAAADGTPFPGPADLQKCINDLDEWVKAIRNRRK